MENTFKCRGKYDVIHWVILGVAFIFSYQFYSSFLALLMVFGLILEFLAPSLFIEGKNNIKKSYGKLLLFVTGIIVSLSLLATCSVIVNEYKKIQDSFDMVKNPQYTSLKQKLNVLQSQMDSLHSQLEEYPTLESLLKNVPTTHSTNRTSIQDNWTRGKKEIQDSLDKYTKEYNETLDTLGETKEYKEAKNKDNQYKTYQQIFIILSDFFKVSENSLILAITLILAVLLEIMKLISKTLAVKERKKKLGYYKPSLDELAQEYYLKQFETKVSEIFINTDNCEYKQESIEPDKHESKEIEKPEIIKEIGTSESQESNIIDFKKKSRDIETIENSDPDNNLSNSDNKELSNKQTYLNYIITNAKNNVIPGLKKSSEDLNISQKKIKEIQEDLKSKNQLYTKDRKTYIK